MKVFRKPKVGSSRLMLVRVIDEMSDYGIHPRNRDMTWFKTIRGMASDDFKRGRRGRRD